LARHKKAGLALLFIANVVWFGGLLRFAAETMVLVIAAIAPTYADRTRLLTWIPGIIVVIILGGIVWLSPWNQALVRQNRADLRAYFGTTTQETGLGLGGTVKLALPYLVPTLVLAVVLPGLLVAAVAVLIGLVVRVLAILIVGTSD
jgi:hypothetical protein